MDFWIPIFAASCVARLFRSLEDLGGIGPIDPQQDLDPGVALGIERAALFALKGFIREPKTPKKKGNKGLLRVPMKDADSRNCNIQIRRPGISKMKARNQGTGKSGFGKWKIEFIGNGTFG